MSQVTRTVGGTVAATGHRIDGLRPPPTFIPGKGAQTPIRDVMPYLVSFARQVVQDIKPELLISGMAVGWDQAVALAAVDLGIPFIAAVPFEGQDQIWPWKVAQEYRRILSLAQQVVVVSPGPFATWKLMARNRWMVDHSQRMLALWNGQKRGGTYQCIQYAQLKRRPIYHVWEGWKEILANAT